MYMEEIVIEHSKRGILAKYLINEERKCKTIIVNGRSLIEKELINFLSRLIKLKLKTYPDKSIDLIVTDPPYNVSRPNNFKTLGSASRIGMDFGEWDKGFDLTNYIDLFPRILKENSNVVIFNAWENLRGIKDACEKNRSQGS